MPSSIPLLHTKTFGHKEAPDRSHNRSLKNRDDIQPHRCPYGTGLTPYDNNFELVKDPYERKGAGCSPGFLWPCRYWFRCCASTEPSILM